MALQVHRVKLVGLALACVLSARVAGAVEPAAQVLVAHVPAAHVPAAAIWTAVGCAASLATGGGLPLWHGLGELARVLRPLADSLALESQTRVIQREVVSIPPNQARRLRATMRHAVHHQALAMRSPGAGPRPIPVVVTDAPWRDGRGAERRFLAHLPDVQCDVCVASAASAEAGEDSVMTGVPDIQTLTTLKMGNSTTLKVTSLQPFSLLFRQHF